MKVGNVNIGNDFFCFEQSLSSSMKLSCQFLRLNKNNIEIKTLKENNLELETKSFEITPHL